MCTNARRHDVRMVRHGRTGRISPYGGITSMPQQKEKNLADVISSLQKDKFEYSLVSWINGHLPIDNLTILVSERQRQPKYLFAHSVEKRVHAHFENLYCTGAYLLDPFFSLDKSGSPEGLYRLKDIAPDQFYRSDYYLTYYKDTTIIDEMVYLLRYSEHISIHVCLGRDSMSGQKFSMRDYREALRLTPVLSALVSQHWSRLLNKKPADADQETDAIARLWNDLEKSYGIVLTARQCQTALLILQGHSSAAIAKILGISHQTVKVFRKQVYVRCSISSQTELFSLMMPILLRSGFQGFFSAPSHKL